MLTKKIAKYIQSLSLKKFRDEEGAFVAEGPKVVSELILSGKFTINLICAEKNWLLENSYLVKEMLPENIFETDDHWLQRISHLKTANKVLAVFQKNPVSLSALSFKNKITLLLDTIQDPGNLGTIIRIADWFGVETVVCSEDCVDCYNPKVVQATMGSLARVNILYSDLRIIVQNFSEIKMYAATLNGESIYKLGKIKEGFILIGNESKGIHAELVDSSFRKITIPKIGHAESLNAAVATGIILACFMNG